MSAYCFFDVTEVTDPDGMERYRQQVMPVVARHGGEYVVIGGECHAVEGTWKPVFPVIIRFDTMEQAKAWYDSDDYRELRELRLASTRGHAVFFSSWPGDQPPP